MDEATISVTLAARNFSDCVNRVRYQGTSFLLEKNGVPVAWLIPVQPNFGSGLEQLATGLRQSRQSPLPKPMLPGSAVQPPVDEDEAMQNQDSAKIPKRRTLNW